MDRFVLTPEMVAAAVDYLPVAEKAAIALTLAPLCLERVMVAVGDPADAYLPAPDLWRPAPVARRRWEMWALLHYWLKVELSEEDTGLSCEEYDFYAAGDPLYQLGLMTTDQEADEKAFRVTQDYRAFTQMLGEEIENQLTVRNDPCARVFGMMAMQSTPAFMAEGVGKLQLLRDELEAIGKEDGGGTAPQAPKKKAPAKRNQAKKTTGEG